MIRTINVHEAKTHLSRLLDEVRAGEEIILAKAGKPYARLVPIAPRRPRQFGFLPQVAPLADAVLVALDEDELDHYDAGL